MGSLALAVKDLWRQKHKSLLFISIQSLITASGTIFYGLAVNIQHQLNHKEAQYVNLVIIQVLNGYLTFLLIFAIMSGILVAGILSALLTTSRMEDLAILLSIGGTFKRIQRIPLAQICLITFISGLIGWVGGILGFIILLTLFQFNTMQTHTVFDLAFGFSYIALETIGTYFIAGFVVNILIRKRFREIVDGQYSIVTINHQRVWGISMKGKISFMLAYLLTKRSKVLSIVMVIGIFMLVFTTTFGILGGSIIQGTSVSYVERGYGTNVYVVSTKLISPILQELYDPSSETKYDYSFNISETRIPNTLIEQLSQSSVCETRLFFGGNVEFLTVYHGSYIDPNISSSHITMNVYYWGIDFQVSIFDYYLIGNSNLSNTLSVYIGDGFFKSELGEESLSSILVHGIDDHLERYNIEGVIVDPFAKGTSIYINSNELTKMFGISNSLRNVLFVKDPPNNFHSLLENYSLEAFNLDILKEKYLSLTDFFWISSTIGSIPVILAAGLSLTAYSGLVVRTVLLKDMKIIRILGGRTRTLKGIIIWINMLSIRAAPLALALSFAVAYSQLIAEPVLPAIEAWIFIALEFFIIGIVLYRYIQKLCSDFSCS